MTQIKFQPQAKALTLEATTEAAWQFAYATLWQEMHFYPKEISRAKKEITHYFQNSADSDNALIHFCERVMLAKRHLAAERSAYLPFPSIWFNRNYPYGFTGTQQWHEQLQRHRQSICGYQEGMSIVAQAYGKYIRYPCRKTFSQCHKKLAQLKEYGLIQLFYNTIIYSQLLHPVK